MAHRRKPRRDKMDRQLIALEQVQPANVIDFPSDRDPRSRSGNLVTSMSDLDTLDIEEVIRRRFDSAESTTNLVSKEIEKSERQFKGLFNDQEEWQDAADDDLRIFMRKTMEHIQIVFSHLDGLTGNLNPLLTLKPSVKGEIHPQQEFERAKVKELVVNYHLDKNRFKKDILPRWRWNFLKHPSAYLRVIFDPDPVEPDIRIDVVDRGMLYIDPYIQTGDIKDAAWVIERGVVTRDEAMENIANGHWWVPDGVGDLSNLFAPPQDDVVRRLIGADIGQADYRGPEKDDLIEVLHYWQAERRGAPHAYGVVLGGKNGRLVRWGPNPFPFTGIPYRGKAYLRDSYKPDGISLANQYRSIQEVYNTFFNLRVEDVLENVKQRFHVIDQLFDENTQEDHENNSKYVRLAGGFAEQIIQSGRKLTDFMLPPMGGDSTQGLLADLQYLGQEGRSETSVNDAFRGQNPQSGATLGQVQEQLLRSLGVFRPIFSQEMTVIEEIGEIINVYFEDPDFFGPERIVSIIGPNRYKDTVQNFFTDSNTGLSARRVLPDEMDVDVTVEVLNQAEHLASRTLRLQQRGVFFESLRHHPELAKEAGRVINFTNLLLRDLEDMGEDIEAITYTPQEQEKRSQEQQQQQQQAFQEQVQMGAMTEQAKEQAKGQREIQVAKAKTGFETERDEDRIEDEHSAKLIEIVAKNNAEHRAAMAEMAEDFKNTIQKMFLEQALEVDAAKKGVNTSVQTGGNDINT